MSTFDATLKKAQETLKVVGTFEEQTIDSRTEQAFKAAGGKLLKRFIAGDAKFSGEILFTVAGADEWNSRISIPLTLPLTRDQIVDLAPTVLIFAGNFVPGSVHLSPQGRLTLTYKDTIPAKDTVAVANKLAWRLTEGHRLAEALKAELARVTTEGAQGFNPTKDKVWQSEMGKPVRLNAEELQVASGGGWKTWFNVVGQGVGTAAGGTAGVSAGVAAGPVTGGTSIAWGGWLGAAGGKSAGGEVSEGLWDMPPVDMTGNNKVNNYCFADDTLVATKDGMRRIAEISAGDIVIGWDPQSGRSIETKVLRNDTHNVPSSMLRIFAGACVVEVTTGHPVLTKAGWSYSEQILEGTEIATTNGFVAVEKVEEIATAHRQLHNLITASATYVVSNLGWVCSSGTNAVNVLTA